MKWENTLMTYGEEVKNRTFWDWLKAHTSFMKPLHNYKGSLKLNEKELNFKSSDDKHKLQISLGDITEVTLGFDDLFTVWEERAAPWNKPLKISYIDNGQEKTIYLFARFHYKYGMRTSDNGEVKDKIKTLIKEDEKE